MSDPELLVVSGLQVSYGGIAAVRGVDLRVRRGSVTVVLGPNGAGKTSLVRGIGGQEKTTGTIVFDGLDISRARPFQVARAGLSQVPQGRQLFSELSVLDNLALGGHVLGRSERSAGLDEAMALFPILGERRHQQAGLLSGGEQQMLAIARALMARPKLLVLDEPSFGLAPLVTREVFDVIERVSSTGVSILLVEQNAAYAIECAEHVYVLDQGRVRFESPADQLGDEVDLIDMYMGRARPVPEPTTEG